MKPRYDEIARAATGWLLGECGYRITGVKRSEDKKCFRVTVESDTFKTVDKYGNASDQYAEFAFLDRDGEISMNVYMYIAAQAFDTAYSRFSAFSDVFRTDGHYRKFLSEDEFLLRMSVMGII